MEKNCIWLFISRFNNEPQNNEGWKKMMDGEG